MRLKEPLYGIKIAQMHFLSHFSLLLVMIILEIEIMSNQQNYALKNSVTVPDNLPVV